MSWKRSKQKKALSRWRSWKDLIEGVFDGERFRFRYRRCSPYVEVKVLVGPWDRMVWHKAVWESSFNAVPMEQRDAMAKNILKRLAERKAKAKTGQAVSDAAAAKAFPNLFTLMTALVDEDASERRVATLTIFADDGCFKACLNERNVSLQLWASSDTLQGIWEALEARLSVDDVDWKEGRADVKGKPGKGRKD